MIIDAKQSNVETYGDIKEFKTGIDPKNLEFITTLLSSNLYSAPEQSFIREIVSNAWDSHVEAGTTDVPVIVRFKGSSYDYTVTIRDYGTGLSPKRFKEVYCNIGSSTKRESNDFIGGFGIGKYSSLACSNTVYITSYYKGTAYYYVMVKSGNAITINLLMEKPTEEKNGVEVTIKNARDIKPYIKALDYIVFFPNVYFDGKDSEFNSVKLKRFNHFAAASINVDHKLLLGNVLYPCNDSHLSLESRQFLKNLAYTGIVIRFDVGEINITPNRESIIYSSDTVEKINNRIKEAKEELETLINAEIEKDYDNLEQYYKATSKDLCYEPVNATLSSQSYRGYKIEAEDIRKLNVTYKGINLKDDSKALAMLYGMTVPRFKGVVYNDKVYTQKLPYSVQSYQRMDHEKLIICNVGARLLASIKMFLRDNYNMHCVMQDLDFSAFTTYVHENVFKTIPSRNEQLIIQGAYDAMYAKATQIDFDTDQNYLALKADLAANKIPKAIEMKEVILYVWDYRFDSTDRKHFKKFSEAVKFIRDQKKGILLGTMDVDKHLYTSVAKVRDLVFIMARKDVVKELKELGLSCFVDFEWMCTKDKKLIEAATVAKCIPKLLSESFVGAVGQTVPKQLRQEFERIYKIKEGACSDYYYRRLFLNVTTYDGYTEHICKMLLDYIEKYKQAACIVDCETGQLSQVLTTAVIMKQKSYRVSAKAYKKVRNNELIKVLCRK